MDFWQKLFVAVVGAICFAGLCVVVASPMMVNRAPESIPCKCAKCEKACCEVRK